MKNTFKKISAFFLFALLLTTVIGGQQASARTTGGSTSWGISLVQVATGVPYYSTYNPVNPVSTSSITTYNLTTNCAIIQFKYNSNIANTWVWVDYNNVTNYKTVDFQIVGGYCYRTVALPNLTPGTHQIQVRAADPNYMSSAIKYDLINVVAPTTTSSAVTVK